MTRDDAYIITLVLAFDALALELTLGDPLWRKFFSEEHSFIGANCYGASFRMSRSSLWLEKAPTRTSVGPSHCTARAICVQECNGTVAFSYQTC